MQHGPSWGKMLDGPFHEAVGEEHVIREGRPSYSFSHSSREALANLAPVCIEGPKAEVEALLLTCWRK